MKGLRRLWFAPLLRLTSRRSGKTRAVPDPRDRLAAPSCALAARPEVLSRLLGAADGLTTALLCVLHALLRDGKNARRVVEHHLVRVLAVQPNPLVQMANAEQLPPELQVLVDPHAEEVGQSPLPGKDKVSARA